MVIAEFLIEAIGTVVETIIDLVPDGKDKQTDPSDGPTPVPMTETEQRPPTGPYEER